MNSKYITCTIYYHLLLEENICTFNCLTELFAHTAAVAVSWPVSQMMTRACGELRLPNRDSV